MQKKKKKKKIFIQFEMEPQEIQHGKEKIFVGSHYISRIPGYFKKIVPKANRFVLLTDSNVYGHYGTDIEKSLRKENLDYIIRVLEPGERTKCRKVKEEIEDWMFQLGCLRDSCIVGMKVIINYKYTIIIVLFVNSTQIEIRITHTKEIICE